MPKRSSLLSRLDAIGHSLEASGHALALIGLGSVGLETNRLDEYSDLDFFAIVADGYKTRYIENLDWLAALCPIVYCFRNTADGYKLLFEDGIFCEFAVFEQAELTHIPFAPGRVVWKQPQVGDSIGTPVQVTPAPRPPDTEWLVGEAITNLYVGMGRFRRGEKLSAQRFVQHYAVDHVLDLAKLIENEQGEMKDIFAKERRFEQRFPDLAAELPRFVQGYERTPESALAILGFLESRFPVNTAMAVLIRQLAAR